jgi:hypothetical protein
VCHARDHVEWQGTNCSRDLRGARNSTASAEVERERVGDLKKQARSRACVRSLISRRKLSAVDASVYTEAHRLQGKLTSRRDVATADGHGLSGRGGSVASGLDDGTRRRPGDEGGNIISGGKEKRDSNTAGSGGGASRGVKNEESGFVSGTDGNTSMSSQRPDKGIVEMRQV